MPHFRRSLIAAIVLAICVWQSVPVGSRDENRPPIRIGRRAVPVPAEDGSHEVYPLQVQNIRFVPSEPVGESPSITLKFDVLNDGVESLTDIILKVSVLEADTRRDAPRAVLAGPFTIRGKAPLHPGFAMTYEIRLRNISSDCGCVGTVHIVSVRGSVGSDTPR
jgi:hypothetical protein